MKPIRKTLRLTGGTVVLRAWGAHVIEAYTLDLLTLTATLGLMREDWPEYTRPDIEPDVWGAFWRLVHASLDGTALPARITWQDRLDLLTALWDLNDLEPTQGKLQALSARAAAMLTRAQGHPTPTMNS